VEPLWLLHNWIRSLERGRDGQRGQTMAEYAILLAVVALVVIAVAIFLGSSISAIFNTASHKV
jgi:Flp pilus assembly pilin Flp